MIRTIRYSSPGLVLGLLLSHAPTNAGVSKSSRPGRVDKTCASKLSVRRDQTNQDPVGTRDTTEDFLARVIPAFNRDAGSSVYQLLRARYGDWRSIYPESLFLPGIHILHGTVNKGYAFHFMKQMIYELDRSFAVSAALWPRLRLSLEAGDAGAARMLVRDLMARYRRTDSSTDGLLRVIFQSMDSRREPLGLRVSTSMLEKKEAFTALVVHLVRSSIHVRHTAADPSLSNVPDVKNLAAGIDRAMVEIAVGGGYESFIELLLGNPWSYSLLVIRGRRFETVGHTLDLRTEWTPWLHEPAVMSFKIESRFLGAPGSLVRLKHLGQISDIEIQSFSKSPTLRFHDIFEARAAFLTKRGKLRRRPPVSDAIRRYLAINHGRPE